MVPTDSASDEIPAMIEFSESTCHNGEINGGLEVPQHSPSTPTTPLPQYPQSKQQQQQLQQQQVDYDESDCDPSGVLFHISRRRMQYAFVTIAILVGFLYTFLWTLEEEIGPVQDSSPKFLVDVNAPPVPIEEGETILSLQNKDMGVSSLESHRDRDRSQQQQHQQQKSNSANSHHFYQRQQQHHRQYQQAPTTSAAVIRAKVGDLPFPVIVADDKIPESAGGGPLHASDALMCRESVINFVINATDVKDECEGLKKAFDKTCNSESSQEGKGNSPHGRRRRRRLFEKPDGHLKGWHLYLYKTSRWISLTVRKLLLPERHFFFPEEELGRDAWDEAVYQVENDLDFEVHADLRRRLEASSSNTVTDENFDVEPANPPESTEPEATTPPVRNETVKEKKKPDKTKMSLALPTSSQHVSESMLSDTLMLHQEDSVIASAIKAAANQTRNATVNDAAVDAATSAKAVSDLSAAVAAVLNDPTTVEARTCCASILNVYHENCGTAEVEEISDSRLFLVVFVIAVCGVVKSLIRHFRIRWLPEAAGCILVGVFFGAVLSFVPHHDFSFDGNWFLRIMVPPIVFEAALGINKRSFNRHIVPILIYAVVGTLIATWLTAFILHRGTKLMGQFCQTIPYVESLTFGALISSIDPIAVLSVLSNMGMTDTDTIYVIIFGESLLNDGVAIVLFQTLVRFLDEELIIDNEAVTAAAIHFLVVFCGSLLVGVGSGMACTVYYWVMHGCQTPLVEGLMFFCWALIPYYICDGIEWSGIVSVVATGFVMDLYVVGRPPCAEMSDDSDHFHLNGMTNAVERRIRRPIFHKEGHLSAVARTHIGFVTEILATMMETAIFAYLGIFLFSYRYHWNGFHVFIAILACCVSRGIMIPVLSLVANWVTKLQRVRANCRVNVNQRKGESKNAGVVIDGRMQMILWIAGLRGAMSFALVENIPLFDTVTKEGSRLKPELKAMTSATIVFTVFFMGGCTFYMMERVGLAPGGSISERKNTMHVELQSLLRKDGDSGDPETESTGRSVDLSIDDGATTGSRSLFRQRPAMGRGPSHDSNQQT